MIRRYEVFADYHQFYLWDAQASPPTDLDFTQEDVESRIKAAPYLVVIQPERNMTVPVEIEVAAAAPDLDLGGWDHVAEASLELPSGRLEIHECTGVSLDVIALAAGWYRVQALFGGLTTLSEDALEGDDHYRLVLWPAPPADVVVLKQFAR